MLFSLSSVVMHSFSFVGLSHKNPIKHFEVLGCKWQNVKKFIGAMNAFANRIRSKEVLTGRWDKY